MNEQTTNRGTAKGKRSVLIVTSVVVACVAASIAVAPFLFNHAASGEDVSDEFSFSKYRAASPEAAEVQTLIDKEDYTLAISKMKRMLNHSDNAIHEFNDLAAVMADEELEYELQLEQTRNSELRWAYVMLLLKTGDDKAAEKELKTYMKHEDWCDNWDDAVALKQALKNKNRSMLERWSGFYADLLK